jgi:hypothetical protein
MDRLQRRRVQLAGKSYALLRQDLACATVIVFVHGFMGCCEKTWLQFQTLPDRLMDPWWHECDFFFYSYDSTRTQIWPNISSLRKFIRDAFPMPVWDKLGSEAGGPERTYRNIMLVGHSEGAVIVRGAILEHARSYRARSAGTIFSKKLRNDDLLRARVSLFSPALFGSLVCGWKGVLLKSPVLGDLVECCLNKSPAYQQLKESSLVLQQIRNETVKMAEKFPDVPAFRASTLFGTKDSIACIATLPTDFPPEYDEAKNHTSICKPSTMYLRPLTFVRETRDAIAA